MSASLPPRGAPLSSSSLFRPLPQDSLIWRPLLNPPSPHPPPSNPLLHPSPPASPSSSSAASIPPTPLLNLSPPSIPPPHRSLPRIENQPFPIIANPRSLPFLPPASFPPLPPRRVSDPVRPATPQQPFARKSRSARPVNQPINDGKQQRRFVRERRTPQQHTGKGRSLWARVLGKLRKKKIDRIIQNNPQQQEHDCWSDAELRDRWGGGRDYGSFSGKNRSPWTGRRRSMGLKEVDSVPQTREKTHRWGRRTINLGKDSRQATFGRREDRKVRHMRQNASAKWGTLDDDDPAATGSRCVSEPALFRCGKSFQSSASSVALSVSTVTNGSHDDNN